jgi:hypothetical protein
LRRTRTRRAPACLCFSIKKTLSQADLREGLMRT